MESDIYHDLGHRRKQLLKANKTELLHSDSMSTNEDNLQMTTNNDNEVARLRELLNRTIEIADKFSSVQRSRADDLPMVLQTARDLADLKAEAALAPAPEEPANPTCHNTTHKFSHCDCKEPDSLDHAPKISHEGNGDAKFKQPEWRELGPDEVICEGDQVQPKHHDRKGAWIWIWSHEIGATPRDQEAMRYRTLRPLPKQEEPLSIFDYHLCLCEDSGENEDLLYCLRYLRDEIQKLKEVK